MPVDLLSKDPLTPDEKGSLERSSEALKNAALAARADGNHHAALQAYFRLIPLLDRLYTSDSLEFASTFSDTAECLIETGKFDGAEEGLAQVLKVREYARYGGLEMGERGLVIVLARENMAIAKEGLKKLLEAREVRMRGKDDDEMVCSNFHKCPSKRTMKMTELNQCGGCRCLFYCSPVCQKSDWKRHKPVCQEHGAVAKIRINNVTS